MKIVKLLEGDSPELTTMFVKKHRDLILKNINNKTISDMKEVIENYIQKKLGDCLFKYKVYVYKLQKSIMIEMLLKPLETANIMEYHLCISSDDCTMVRVR